MRTLFTLFIGFIAGVAIALRYLAEASIKYTQDKIKNIERELKKQTEEFARKMKEITEKALTEEAQKKHSDTQEEADHQETINGADEWFAVDGQDMTNSQEWFPVVEERDPEEEYDEEEDEDDDVWW